jgi:hypothetical protein
MQDFTVSIYLINTQWVMKSDSAVINIEKTVLENFISLTSESRTTLGKFTTF